MRSRLRSSLWTLSLLLTLAGGILLGSFVPRDDDFFALQKSFQIFSAAYEELVTGYVEPLDPERLMRVALDAMLRDLDPYTTLIEGSINTDLDILSRGRMRGEIGLFLEKRSGGLTVTSIMGGGSEYQGIRVGDVILRVSIHSTRDLSVEEVRALLEGRPGTRLDVQVRREGVPRPMIFTLTREQIRPQNVTHRSLVDPGAGIGYIKLERFTRGAHPEMQEALHALRQQALQRQQPLRGVILDLRDNPGGLLDAAVRVTEMFVSNGAPIVTIRGQRGEIDHTFHSRRPPLAPDLPLVLLVNGASASSSEIVAGAIQDLDRGVILGTRTYGKGLVQIIRSLPHEMSLKMTTSRYYTPSGRSIQSDEALGGEALPEETRTQDRDAPEEPPPAVYRTANGRRVAAQKGVEPDIERAPLPPSALEEALTRSAAFFRFANHYAATRDSLSVSFQASDADVAAFQRWLRTDSIAYPSQAERSLAAFEDQFLDASLADVRDEVDALRIALRQRKDSAFRIHQDALKHRLEAEILARFVPQTEQVAAALRHDPQVSAAVSVLADTARYRALLTPSPDD